MDQYHKDYWDNMRTNYKDGRIDCDFAFKIRKTHDAYYLVDNNGIVLSNNDTKRLIQGLQLFVDNCSDEYVNGKISEGIEDMIEYEKRFLDPSRKSKERKPIDGYVYLIKATDTLYKIGVSKDPQRRLEQLNGKQSPYKLEIVHLIKSDDMYESESELHAYFENKKSNNEWFELSSDDVEYIKAM